MKKRLKGAVALAALCSMAATAFAVDTLESSIKANEAGIKDAVKSIGGSIAKSTDEYAKQKAAAPKCTPNSADPYVPKTDSYGQPSCLPSWELVNRDYISPSCPGVVINPSCVRGGGHDRALAKCTPNSADPYVPRNDQWGYPYCLPGSELAYRDYISPSCPGVVINPSCIRGGGHDRARAGEEPIRGLPGHYYPGTIDNPPNVDCGIGRQLTYWGVDQWVCSNGGGHERALTACTPNSADPYVPRKDPWGYPECLPGMQLVNRDYISPSCPGVVINPSCIRGGDHDGGHGGN